MNTASVRITALASELGVSVFDVVTACSRSGIVGDGLRVSADEAEIIRSTVQLAPPVDTPPPALPPSNVEVPGSRMTVALPEPAVDLRDDRPAIVVVPGPNVSFPRHKRRRLGRIASGPLG